MRPGERQRVENDEPHTYIHFNDVTRRSGGGAPPRSSQQLSSVGSSVSFTEPVLFQIPIQNITNISYSSSSHNCKITIDRKGFQESNLSKVITQLGQEATSLKAAFREHRFQCCQHNLQRDSLRTSQLINFGRERSFTFRIDVDDLEFADFRYALSQIYR